MNFEAGHGADFCRRVVSTVSQGIAWSGWDAGKHIFVSPALEAGWLDAP